MHQPKEGLCASTTAAAVADEISYYAVLKIRSNAEIVCHEQTVMTRVADNIQSSSRRSSGSRRLVLKPLSHVGKVHTSKTPEMRLYFDSDI